VPALSSRRALVAAVLAGAVGGTSLIALAADPTLGCSFTDPAGDSAVEGIPGSGDDDLDILTVGFSSTAEKALFSAKLKKLKNSGPDDYLGDDFEFGFTLNGKEFQVGGTRVGDPNGGPPLRSSRYAFVNGTNMASSAPSLAVTYDLKTSIVETSLSLVDLSKLAGASAQGAVASKLGMVAYAYHGGPESVADEATGKAATYAFGDRGCDGAGGSAPASGGAASPSPSGGSSPAPSGSASPAPSGSASPAPSGSASPGPSPSGSPGGTPDSGASGPTPGCADITDPKGDAQPNATNPGAPTPNDPDLDILAVNFQTEPETLKAYLKIDKLGARPAAGNGHRFNATFTVNGKIVEVYAGQPDSVASGANAALLAAGQGAPAAGGVRIAGTYNPKVKTSAVFDIKASRVVLAIDRATLDAALGTPASEGSMLTATQAVSRIFTPTAGSVPADTAQAVKADEQVYTVGDNRCFVAVAASAGTPTLTVSVPPRVQTSDPARVGVTLTDGAGKPIAGQAVTARIGRGPLTTAKTDAGGRALLRPSVIDAAGARILVVRYAGGADGANAIEQRKTTIVVAEVSRITHRTVRTGPTRAFTITLTDDDVPAHPYAGATVTFEFDGRKVSAVTNRNGQATITVRPTRIDIRYAGRTGFVRPAYARAIVS